MIILGLNAYHADAAAAIVVDGKLVAAVEEDRELGYRARFPYNGPCFRLGCLDP